VTPGAASDLHYVSVVADDIMVPLTRTMDHVSVRADVGLFTIVDPLRLHLVLFLKFGICLVMVHTYVSIDWRRVREMISD
jgi:hypothetical protein